MVPVRISGGMAQMAFATERADAALSTKTTDGNEKVVGFINVPRRTVSVVTFFATVHSDNELGTAWTCVFGLAVPCPTPTVTTKPVTTTSNVAPTMDKKIVFRVLSILAKYPAPRRCRVFVVIASEAAPPGNGCLQWATTETWFPSN